MPMSNYQSDLRAKVGGELLLAPSVTGIVYDDAGRILLVKHADTGVWVAPGGSIEPNESPTDAVVREMWEETGLLVEPVRVIGVYGGPNFEVTYRNGDRVTYVMTVFECRVLTGEIHADGVETLLAAYFGESEVTKLAISEWLQVVLPDVFRKQEKTSFQQSQWQPQQ